MNPSIGKMILGKPEEEAVAILIQYDCIWRIVCRDGKNNRELPNDRDDRRYSIFIRAGKVERVVAG
jgi:hypothetical protein